VAAERVEAVASRPDCAGAFAIVTARGLGSPHDPLVRAARACGRTSHRIQGHGCCRYCSGTPPGEQNRRGSRAARGWHHSHAMGRRSALDPQTRRLALAVGVHASGTAGQRPCAPWMDHASRAEGRHASPRSGAAAQARRSAQ
jgi:hypothetical protein